jgi:tetratricopeptide (TPR) repeat protein
VRVLLVLCAILSFAVFAAYCTGSKEHSFKSDSYLNLNDSATYVGMSTCKQCHVGIHERFTRTGMGQSLSKASKAKSAAKFGVNGLISDIHSGYSYQAFWRNDSLVIRENKNQHGISFSREQIITYIIGSGQHTNSHLTLSNGYLYQAPLTYYTQDGKWDLPPGFENGGNEHFDRQIGLECMSCHNAYPEFVLGSINKYKSIPQGIDCERCHGPGSIHVSQKQQGITIDTSKYIDFSIVNPAKLPIDKQFDLCQRCHLQGNAILIGDKSFLDFRPGMELSEVLEVYLPRYDDSKESFIMASHADRLKQSQCFIQMKSKAANETSLRPYKNALTCVTCHNPHISVKETQKQVYIQACKNCHTKPQLSLCSESLEKRAFQADDCVSCHMPLSGSVDIPHVKVHDHFIRKNPESGSDKVNPNRRFLQLECINNDNPSLLNRARAYLQQFEKFDSKNEILLDSARSLLESLGGDDEDSLFNYSIQLNYLSKNFKAVINIAENSGHSRNAYFRLIGRTFSNNDAWTAYQIGEAYSSYGMEKQALMYYYISYRLAPFYFEFTNKYATSALLNKMDDLAYSLFKWLSIENPEYAPAWTNLGYIMLLRGENLQSLKYSEKALKLNPDYLQAHFNMAGALSAMGNSEGLIKELKLILAIDPGNTRAKQALSHF